MVSPTYKSWDCMKQRCDNPNNPDYWRYGGRGIGYTTAWKQFYPFLKDMGERPEGRTLDRIDNDKDYYKENCRWATPLTQARNKGLLCTNTSGVTGVRWKKHKWWTTVHEGGRPRDLYIGRDFFEAVCRRKSWEQSHIQAE